MGNDNKGDENLANFAYPQVGQSVRQDDGNSSGPQVKTDDNNGDDKSVPSDKNTDNGTNKADTKPPVEPEEKVKSESSENSNSNNENSNKSIDTKDDKDDKDNDTDTANDKASPNDNSLITDKNSDKDPQEDKKVAKPADLEAQLSSLSGLSTPKAAEKKEDNESKPDDLSQPKPKPEQSSEDASKDISAPPTLGKGEVKAKDSSDSPLKKIASKLSKVKDEIVDPNVSMGDDGLNLSGNNPIETPSVPPAIGPNQEPMTKKEFMEMKEKELDKKEVEVMKDQLKTLRDNEQKTENISVNSDQNMDQKDANTGTTNQAVEQTSATSSSTQAQQNSSNSVPSIPPITSSPTPPPVQTSTPPSSAPVQSSQTPPPPVPKTTQPATSQASADPAPSKPDPMGLNQPMQPIKQIDPNRNDNAPEQTESPLKSEQTNEEQAKFQDMAKEEIAGSTPVQTSVPTRTPMSTTPPTAQLNPAVKPTLPNDPVVPNPTVTKVTEDLAPEVDEKHKATPMATLKKPEGGDEPKVKHSRYPYTIDQLLDIVVERDASDLHVTVGYPAMIRVDGALVNVLEEPVKEAQAPDLILPVLPEQKKELLDVNREVDLAYPHREDARFRINAYYQQQTLAAAFRLIPNRIRSIDELNLPQVYHKLTKLKQGLVLVTGPTGSGKSTTLAAIIQEINENRPDHIITIEDPVEYVFPKGMGMVDQRELHEDTHSWEIALRSAMRQDPDVILVGEMRDYETISAAITLAETGHLVFATLHTNSAAQTLDRIVDVFPEHQQAQVRSQLSLNIEAVIAQRLIPLQRGGRTAVSEIMIATPAIRNLIREAKTHQIDNVIRTSADIGMISLEHTLVRLVRENIITMERAQEYAVHPEEIVRLLKS